MRLRWTQLAAQDLTHICDFITEHGGPTAARGAALAIFEEVSVLAQFPEAGRTGRKHDTRELVIARFPYVVIYRLRNENVEVLRILHSSQKWP